MSYQKKCNSCGLLDPKRDVCLITGLQVDSAEDFCSKHQDGKTYCEICGRQILIPIIDVTNSERHIITCVECHGHFGTCEMCSKSNDCSFETDPSPIPKMVQRRVQNGPMISVTTIPNPDRVAITCQINCSCFHQEFGCLKQNGTCGNYKCKFDEV